MEPFQPPGDGLIPAFDNLIQFLRKLRDDAGHDNLTLAQLLGENKRTIQRTAQDVVNQVGGQPRVRTPPDRKLVTAWARVCGGSTDVTVELWRRAQLQYQEYRTEAVGKHLGRFLFSSPPDPETVATNEQFRVVLRTLYHMDGAPSLTKMAERSNLPVDVIRSIRNAESMWRYFPGFHEGFVVRTEEHLRGYLTGIEVEDQEPWVRAWGRAMRYRSLCDLPALINCHGVTYSDLAMALQARDDNLDTMLADIGHDAYCPLHGCRANPARNLDQALPAETRLSALPPTHIADEEELRWSLRVLGRTLLGPNREHRSSGQMLMAANRLAMRKLGPNATVELKGARLEDFVWGQATPQKKEMVAYLDGCGVSVEDVPLWMAAWERVRDRGFEKVDRLLWERRWVFCDVAALLRDPNSRRYLKEQISAGRGRTDDTA
ncbi:hypothetical protein [Streptomyces longispororuber]|uniref:hypothetical protein n=1 Tax=Streptomyces longispororuber TaxID=68230 RepID=UPI0021095DC0|nr:hypothetical protein [Streptomyces longispororuber]MCQ4213385.1 hypothetical protein [Streptomyces longispororuber]